MKKFKKQIIKWLLLGLCLLILALSNCVSSNKTKTVSNLISLDKAGTISNLISLEEALVHSGAELSNKVKENTEIAVIGIEAPFSNIKDFLTEELILYLVNIGKFTVLERNRVSLALLDNEHQFQMSGMVSDESAIGIGHYLGAKIIITGSFSRFADFSQIRLRVLDVETAQILAVYTSRIKPDDKMIASFIKSMANPPNITEAALAYLNKGEDLLKEGKLDEAINEFNKAIEIDYNLSDAYFNRALAYSQKDDSDLEIEDWTQVLRINMNSGIAYHNRGNAFSTVGDFDKAIIDYNRAIRLRRDDISVYCNRALAYSYKGNIDQAIADYTQAIQIKPDNPNAYIKRGVVYFNIRDLDNAIENWEMALRVDPYPSTNRLQLMMNLDMARRMRGF